MKQVTSIHRGKSMTLLSRLILTMALAIAPTAFSAPIISITPDALSRTVLEGQSGLFDFTVKNLLGADDVKITDVLISIDFFLFLSGEPEDEVYATIKGPDNCTGKTLGPGGTCLFTEIFRTRDLKPDKDVDSGKWDIFNFVLFTVNGVGGNSSSPAEVIVKDVPEPSTCALFSVALAALCLFRKKSKNKSQTHWGGSSTSSRAEPGMISSDRSRP